jgi:predicted lipoprotein with Yx(FWY)xxD motif
VLAARTRPGGTPQAPLTSDDPLKRAFQGLSRRRVKMDNARENGMRSRLLVSILLSALAAVLTASALAGSESSRATVTLRSSNFGKILFDGGNRALYAFTRDPRAKTTCYGACAAAWPPYIVRGTLKAGAGTKRSLLGTIRRRNGKRQLTYAGKALYYYAHEGPGEVLCQNVREFGGLWLVVRASGKLVR